MNYIRGHLLSICLTFVALGLITLGVVLFIQGGVDNSPPPELGVLHTGYNVPACTPSEVQRIVEAKPLKDQYAALNVQANQLNLKYINDIEDGWRYNPGQKLAFTTEQQSILDQQTVLTIRITALVGTIYCK